MPRRNKLRAQLIRAVNQPTEFQILVAHHARVRRATGFVFVREILNDLGLKLRRLVDEIIGDTQLIAHRPGIADRLRSAALILGARDAILRPEFQGDADDVVTLFKQKRGRSGGVHSTAHATDHAGARFGMHRRTVCHLLGPCKML